MPQIDDDGGDYGAGIIRGLAVVTRGEAIGHWTWIDDAFVQQVADAINAKPMGVKSRFTHPGLSGDGLGKFLGRVKNAWVDDGITRADLHLAKSARSTPDGDLAEYVIGLAREDPLAFATSIVYEPDFEAEGIFEKSNLDEDGDFISPDEDNMGNVPHARLKALLADDIVDEPAANPGGLFHRGDDIAEEAEKLAEFALGLSNEKPKLVALSIEPSRVAAFVGRFLDRHGLHVVPKGGLDMATNASTNQAQTDQVDLKGAIASLRVKYPDDPAFVLEMLEMGASIEIVDAEYTRRRAEKLTAENANLRMELEKVKGRTSAAPKQAGPAPVQFSAEPKEAGGDFIQQARELAARTNVPVYKAMSKLASDHPELHAAFVNGSRNLPG